MTSLKVQESDKGENGHEIFEGEKGLLGNYD